MNRALLVYTGIVALVIHFTFTLIFCFQDKLNSPTISGAANHYTYPLFTQNWKVFAPDPPTTNRQLFYRCIFADSTNSDWIDPGEENLRKFQRTRFITYAKLQNVYESINRELISISDYSDETIVNTEQYKLACRYFSDKAKKTFLNKKISRIEFKYEEQPIVFRGEQSIETIKTFPPIIHL